MVWKQDLAKLKQQLGPEAPAPKPQPKPAPKPEKAASMDEEDAVFLSAMGLKPRSSRPSKPEATALEPAAAEKAPSESQPESQPAAAPASASVSAPVPEPVPETFQEAIRDLKGLKPLAKALPGAASPPKPRAPRAEAPAAPPTPPVLASVAPPSLPPVVEAPSASPSPSPSTAPLRFQLAAGMAIEVDGTLDLRGHSLADAMERLKDRLGDGTVLGWRSLQVTLGPDPVLHEGLLSLLTAGEAPMVARYAQAPVPMGGTQAWLLYFGPPPVQP